MVAHKRRTECSADLRFFTSCGSIICGTSARPRRFGCRKRGELNRMAIHGSLKALIVGCAMAAIAGCRTAPPPPMVVPASFTPLGVTAPYLMGDVIGGQKARAAKMKAAKIRPLSPAEVGAYMADLDAELRRQTAGIGLDVLQVGGAIIVRVPAAFTFDAGSAAVGPR